MQKLMKKDRKQKYKKIILTILIMFTISVMIGTYVYIDTSLRPAITILAETKAQELANRAINKAVADVVKDSIDYENLINIKTDEQGNISMLQSNTILMNEIASDVALEIQDEMKKVKKTSAYIPIGTALNSPILAQYGPQIKVSIEPIGTVFVDFKTEFESSGINQTIHRIYLEVKTEVNVVIPLTTSTQQVKAQVPICENIIVGDVPESYVNIPEDDMLNVLPEAGDKPN